MVDFDGFLNLRFLSFGYCDLTGQIPAYLSKNLEELALNNNRIRGPIPSWLGTLPRLRSMDLSSNLISGEFPKELCGLPMLVSKQTVAQVDSNDLELPVYTTSGVLVASQINFRYIRPTIDISMNIMSGKIPIEIGQLRLLHGLYLSNNNFSGNIPEQISKLKNLEKLDRSLRESFVRKNPTIIDNP
ncbi:putative non-specific serine/threonine protein kinase [Rosa chinensis]|uniref:Putative non-specific serine/threonine protein kinase n=1 Tax=Rosa chinensis TaxID=74649 RepID=A0A2P6QKB4_ROSCH|nr:putative non-specific serine/threonine protein kinase [Rosa chinensis]